MSNLRKSIISKVGILKSLVREAEEVYAESEILKLESIRINNQINVFAVKFDEVFDTLSWEEKEKMYGEAESLYEELNNCITRLNLLSAKYNDVCKRVNEYYGKEKIMPVSNIKNFLGDDDGEIDLL